MKFIQPMKNLMFMIGDSGDCHCISYGSEVAAIINGEYVEFQGPQYYSRTSMRHKAMFRTHFGIGG